MRVHVHFMVFCSSSNDDDQIDVCIVSLY